jgi:hypothetical protein
MTQATRVHSTPPTNTSAINPVDPTRRGFITLAAGASVISVGSLAAVAMPIAAAAPTAAVQVHDAKLIELGARFEPLVARYYVAQRRWSKCSDAEASDALSATFLEMKQLANAINAAPVTSIEGLRAKALVAFYEVAPLCKGDTEFSFDDAYPFQQLFTAVAELCGLKNKIAATDYELPDIGGDDSDDEGEEA